MISLSGVEIRRTDFRRGGFRTLEDGGGILAGSTLASREVDEESTMVSGEPAEEIVIVPSGDAELEVLANAEVHVSSALLKLS